LYQINVFKLGHTYLKLIQQIPVEHVQPVAPENLIRRFAARLEFGKDMNKVAKDAVRLVQRMNRDWMGIGRHPAGVCGACLVLAARMNNYRRTIREVVYVVKVSDTTIEKRLEEFKITPSSQLSVQQFRTMWLEGRHDPPAFYEDRKKKPRRRRGKGKASLIEDGDDQTDEEEEDEDEAEEDPSPRKTARIDKDGFAVPELPIDPALLAASQSALSELDDRRGRLSTPIGVAGISQPRGPGRPGRPSNAENRELNQKIMSEADLAIEEEIESEISKIINNPETQAHADLYATSLKTATLTALANRPVSNVPDAEEIGEEEFENDPEVRHCRLSEAEVEVKERIWVHENQDFLREQQRKLLKKEMEEKNGTGRVIKRRKRRGRVGDGEEGTPAASPAEAVRNMVKQRGFSKKINYQAIDDLFETGSTTGGSVASNEERIAERVAMSQAASEAAEDAFDGYDQFGEGEEEVVGEVGDEDWGSDA
jgi:transcription factor IIIB 90 kDa subunit